MNKADRAEIHPACPISSAVLALCLTASVASLFSPLTVRANVYATNVRINGGTTNTTFASTNVAISYILNEPATLGVSIEIKQGTNTARSINITNGVAGALKGTNVVFWDGKDGNSNRVAGGSYSVSITTRATGFEDWTQVSDDNNPGNYVWEPRGIAVNQNPNSPYYGRVFVGNSHAGPNAGGNPGDTVGLLKLNADGSLAQEGVFSDGGWNWAGDFNSPWKIEVGPDDRVYVDDFTQQGVVVSFDQLLSSNSLKVVLRNDNWPSDSANLSGPFITSNGTNLQVWMADAVTGGSGIRRWDIGTNGVIATNDTGFTIVQSGAGSDLSGFPYDVAVDGSNNIYTIQRQQVSGDPANRVFRFPTYTGTAETLADWKVGTTNDTMAGAYGVAVNPAGTRVAVAFIGIQVGFQYQYGAVRVFDATNGAALAQPTPVTSPSHDYRDVAWDAAGNLYLVDNSDSNWRVFSPPGTNQSTTIALATVTVPAPPVEPVLSQPTYSGGQLSFLLTGEANIIYYIEVSTNLLSWTRIATNNSVFASRTVTVPAPSSLSFYRVVIGAYSPAPPVLTAQSFAAGQFQFSLLGGSNYTYVIFGSTNLQSWDAVATNSSGGALRQITITAPSPRNFYRAQVLP